MCSRLARFTTQSVARHRPAARVRNPFHSFAWRRRCPPCAPPKGGTLLPDGAVLAQAAQVRPPPAIPPLSRPRRGAGSASAQPPTSRRSRLTGGEGRALWRGLRVGSVPGWGALGGCVGGRISTPTVRAQARWPGACRFHEVSPAPSVMVGARCAGGVAGGQPRALPGPLDRREQRRARGGDGRRLALRQGSEGTRTPGAHRRHRAALRRLGLPARAQAEAAGGGGGEGRRVLRGDGRYNDGIERSAARLTSRRSLPRRKDAVLTLSAARAAPRTGAAPRLLPVAARASTGASVADATFLVGISSRRSIGASSAPLAPLPSSPRWCSGVAL